METAKNSAIGATLIAALILVTASNTNTRLSPKQMRKAASSPKGQAWRSRTPKIATCAQSTFLRLSSVFLKGCLKDLQHRLEYEV